MKKKTLFKKRYLFIFMLLAYSYYITCDKLTVKEKHFKKKGEEEMKRSKQLTGGKKLWK